MRINPDELHVRDTAWMDTLYALGQRRDKQLRMVKMFGAPLSSQSGACIFAQRKVNPRIRQPLAPRCMIYTDCAVPR